MRRDLGLTSGNRSDSTIIHTPEKLLYAHNDNAIGVADVSLSGMESGGFLNPCMEYGSLSYHALRGLSRPKSLGKSLETRQR